MQTIPTSDLQHIIERLKVVERQNQTLKRTGAAFLAVFIAFAIMNFIVLRRFHSSQTATARSIRAHKFEIVDSSGRTRGIFGMTTTGIPSVLMYDDKGNLRVDLDADELGPGLGVYDAGEHLRADLAVGVTDAFLNLYNPNAIHPAIRLDLSSPFPGVVGSLASLEFRTKDDEPLLELEGIAGEPNGESSSLALYGQHKVVWQAPNKR